MRSISTESGRSRCRNSCCGAVKGKLLACPFLTGRFLSNVTGDGEITSESLSKKRKRKRNRLTRQAYKESIVLLVMQVIFLHYISNIMNVMMGYSVLPKDIECK